MQPVIGHGGNQSGAKQCPTASDPGILGPDLDFGSTHDPRLGSVCRRLHVNGLIRTLKNGARLVPMASCPITTVAELDALLKDMAFDATPFS
jgi:hypothetical protein